MPFGEATSAFWFYERLHPSQWVPPFSVEEVPVADRVRLEVVWDGIGVWSRPGTTDFKQPGEATTLFRLVTASYALLALEALEVTMDGWIEATEAELAGSVIGFRVDRPRSPADVNPDSDESKAMRAAAELAVAICDKPAYRLAVRDIHGALRDPSDDAFFFGFRAVEDVARAVSGSTGELTAKEWATLHEQIGLTPEDGKARLESLTRARRAAAHGATEDPELGEARRRRDALLDEARRFVITTLMNEPNLPHNSLRAALPSGS
jgi:hypothetical protein